MDPITIAALISGGASILGGLFQSNASDKAAKAQGDAANRSIDLQAATLAQARLDAAPWLDAGKKALAQYQGELGMGGPGFQSQFAKTPGYDFAVSEGEKGVTNNLAALGMKNSGAALKALTRFRTGIANQNYDNYLGRLSGQAGVGQNQVNTTNANALNSASTIGGLMQDAGAARASGYAGSANAWSGALSNLAGTAGSWLGAQKGSGASLFSGSSALGGI
jgi:hypothetical protein